MCFHLHQDVNGLFHLSVDVIFRIREESFRDRPFDDCGIILVGGKHALTTLFIGVADHLEERPGLGFAVHFPGRIEDLVATVFGVGLSKHHQFDIGGIASQMAERVHQIADLIIRQRQAPLPVGLFQRSLTTLQDIHGPQWPRLGMGKEQLGTAHFMEYGLGHAVVQFGSDKCTLLGIRHVFTLNVIRDAPLDTFDIAQSAVVGNVRGLAGPRRDGSRARHHEKQRPLRGFGRLFRPVVQQLLECLQV